VVRIEPKVESPLLRDRAEYKDLAECQQGVQERRCGRWERDAEKVSSEEICTLATETGKLGTGVASLARCPGPRRWRALPPTKAVCFGFPGNAHLR